MSKWTEWREETKESIASWWAGSPMARGFVAGLATCFVIVVIIWAA